MGIPPLPGPSGGSQQTPWWLLNLAAMVVGVALVGIGVYDHDNQALVTVGTGVITLAVGHALGVQQPVP